MGLGLNKLATQTPHLDYYLHDLAGVVFEQSIGTSRFLKTIKCVHDEGSVVVKMYVKRPPYTDLKEYQRKLTEIRANFRMLQNRNVFPIQKFIETDKAAYGIRQYFLYNLYDRIGTRPFLTTNEKKWIAFQLLKALEQTHRYGICHGDIKCENVMVTSSCWVYLTDFACYKPTAIPEDDPADFSFFFDTSGRRTCYLAPERFFPRDKLMKTEEEQHLTPEMDVFSTGCAIAELFLDGVPIFNFAQLLAYRKGEYDPSSSIDRVDDIGIRALVKSMIQRDPAARLSASGYINGGDSFGMPKYFGSLYECIDGLLKKQTGDEKVQTLFNDWETILLPRIVDDQAAIPSNQPNASADIEFPHYTHAEGVPYGVPPEYVDDYVEFRDSLSEGGHALLYDTDKFMVHLKEESTTASNESTALSQKEDDLPSFRRDSSNLHLSLGGRRRSESVVAKKEPKVSEGMTIILNILCCCIRDVESPQILRNGLELMRELACHVDDECRLQRMVPYTISILQNNSAAVRSSAIYTLVEVLDKVHSFPLSDAHIFPDYIMPSLAPCSTDSEELVRATYAANLASLAEIARRFLEASQEFKQTSLRQKSQLSPRRTASQTASAQSTYDRQLQELQHMFYDVLHGIFTKDTSSSVKRTLLCDITRLAHFFGRQQTNDFLLPLIITFLNDRDWQLRCAFFNNIVGISTFVGQASLESFIYPCILQDLVDEEEFVIDKAANSLATLVQLGLFRKRCLYDIVNRTAPMLTHPNQWIRFGVVAVMASVAKQLEETGIQAMLMSSIRPFLVGDIETVTEASMLEALKPPVSRSTFEKALKICAEILQSFASGAGRASETRRRPTKTFERITEVKLEDDPFMAAFSRALELALVIGDEKETVLLMTTYIKTATRGLHMRRVFSESETEGDNEREMGAYTSLRRAGVPVYTATSAEHASKAEMNPIFMSPPETAVSSTPKDLDGPSVRSLGLPDLGILRRMDNKSCSPVTGEALRSWVPQGILIANLFEHSACVNEIAVSDDDQFFVTASDDGTVRLWDCQRLEKNVTNRSRAAYSEQSGKIKCATVLQHSHTVASGSTNGSIHLFKVDNNVNKKDMLIYTGLQSIRHIEPELGGIVAVDHFNRDLESLIAYATTRGHVNGHDIRMKQDAFELKNPAKSGLVLSFCIEPNHNWLVTGTAKGCYTCWDLRFQIPVKTWWHPKTSPIYSLSCYNNSIRGESWIWGGSRDTELYLWDIETAQCQRMIRVVDAEKPIAPPILKAGTDKMSPMDYKAVDILGSDRQDGAVRAILNPLDAPFMITGGSDRKLRFWDFQSPGSSFVLSGLDNGERPPTYKRDTYEAIPVIQELQNSREEVQMSNRKRYGSTAPSINHHDCIMDVKALELPLKMLISCSRDGLVKVWK